jgi:hypothetical protein
MTCDPVAGYVQVPCIERCAFGAVKAWIAFMIATNEIASRHRVDLDTTSTLAETAGIWDRGGDQRSRTGLNDPVLIRAGRPAIHVRLRMRLHRTAFDFAHVRLSMTIEGPRPQFDRQTADGVRASS